MVIKRKRKDKTTWEDAIQAFKNSKGHGRVPPLPKYSPLTEPFDKEFQRLVKVAMKRHIKGWINTYKRIDGQELVAARYRMAMNLPHQGGRKILAKYFAQMDFLFGIYHYIERRD